MKFKSLPVLLILVIIVSSFPIVQSYATPTKRTTLHPFDNQVIQVWFDSLPKLAILYPPSYSFNVAAKTSSGLWITSLHWDFGDGSTLDVPYSTQNQVSEIRTHQYTDQRNYCVIVTAQDNAGNIGTASVSLMPDFKLTAAPPTQTVKPGDSATYTVNVGLFCGRSVHVDLTTSLNQNPPAGLKWSLNPDSGNTSFTSILTVTTSSNTPSGTYIFSILGTGAGKTQTATVTLIVPPPTIPPDFAVSVSPPSIVVSAQDHPGTVTVTVKSLYGFNNPVILNVTTKVAGLTFSPFSPYSITPPPNGAGASQTMISADCSVNSGTYTFQITGTDQITGTMRQASLNVTVNGCPFPIWPVLGIILLLLMVPVIFFLIKGKRAPATPVILLPRADYCMTCGRQMVFYEEYRRWYCTNCGRFV